MVTHSLVVRHCSSPILGAGLSGVAVAAAVAVGEGSGVASRVGVAGGGRVTAGDGVVVAGAAVAVAGATVAGGGSDARPTRRKAMGNATRMGVGVGVTSGPITTRPWLTLARMRLPLSASDRSTSERVSGPSPASRPVNRTRASVPDPLAPGAPRSVVTANVTLPVWMIGGSARTTRPVCPMNGPTVTPS